MDTDSTTHILPPSRNEATDATTLVFTGQVVTLEDDASTPIYQLSRELACTVQKHTSIIFERVEFIESGESGSVSSRKRKRRSQDLFYLVHPAHAQYRNDLPAYYITAASPGTLGNIQFDISKTVLQKADFKAMLNADRSAADVLLFNRETQQTLFEVKPKWKGGHYQWIDTDGQKVAYESGKGDEHKLIIQVALQQQVKDALVALWVLRLWHDSAESRTAKRQELEELTGPVEPSSYPSTKTLKGVAAGGALAGAGGGGC
ncbi:hypothetical protein NW762_009345 [Fusarium torreyae]|uniref:Uncharacterized protein n=1 Tax=Fusarium torreyae TaxID=1237075 RepID=A0A9W8VEQ1_9HYPO|nr:hypothetical protein NW762_009345 [Fusarium torreyae]